MSITEAIVGKKLSQTGSHYVLATNTGKTLTVAKADWVEGSNLVTYEVNKAGDTFVASRNSTRVFPALLEDGVTAHPKAGQPLYLQGETVTRTQTSFNVTGFENAGSLMEAIQVAKAMA